MNSTSSSKAMRSNHAGCTGGILRRFLRTGLLVRAFGRGADEVCNHADVGGGLEEEGWKPAAAIRPAPGVVARLMGLDAMPPAARETAKVVVVPCDTGRSRSMSSIEGGWPIVEEEVHGPRFKKSSSFREIPTFLRPENEDFLLLSFGPDDGEEEEISAAVKNETSLLELEENGRDGERLKIAGKKKNSGKNKKTKKAIDSETRTDSESSSQNSSPVSVLDGALGSNADYFIDVQQASVSGDRSSVDRGQDSHSRRCCSTNPSSEEEQIEEDPSQRNSRRRHRSQLEITRSPSPGIHRSLISDMVMRSLTRGNTGIANAALSSRGSGETWGEICRLAGEDVKRTNWVLREWRKMKLLEDVGVGIEVQMFDLLLQEFVEELLFSPFLPFHRKL